MPALLVEGVEDNKITIPKRYLVVSDIHIGIESKLATNDIFVGKNSSVTEIIAQIKNIIESSKPDSVILLGDIKSSTSVISKTEWHDVPLFFEELQKHVSEIVLVPGNHDANIQRLMPKDVTMTGPSGLVLEDVLFTHGHVMPSENFAHVKKIVMGHVHPVFFDKESVLNGQRVWVSLKAQKQDIFASAKNLIEVLLMPSFNKYLYATHRATQYKKKRSISPIMQRITRVESAKIVTLQGSIIGDEHVIHKVM